MSLLRLKAEQFRNLQSPELDFHPACNLIYGSNGSGKTSLLEAMHYLCLARSFRSHQASRIICNETSSFTLFGQFEVKDNPAPIPAGIEKHRNGETKIKIEGNSVRSVSELAQLHPLQLINASTFHLLDAGPQHRREFLDWGVFHVEPSFFPIWKRLQIASKQRNAALRQSRGAHSSSQTATQVKIWDTEFIAASYELNTLRRAYIETFLPMFEETLGQLIYFDSLSINYYPGWDEETSLQTILDRNFERDLALGYTQYGPQRADLTLKIRNQPLDEILSRGEQKLVTYALRHAQGLLLNKTAEKPCIYLVDDLAAELDTKNRDAILNLLQSSPFQVFITVLDHKSLDSFIQKTTPKMFHVEQGRVTMVGE